MSAYIHSQYLLQRITSDFFQDMKEEQPLSWKAFPSQNKHDDSESGDEVPDDDDVTDNNEHLDKSTEMIDNDRVYYCHPDNVTLSYEFDLCDGNAYTVVLCPYKINYQGKYPFVQYCLVPGENGNWTFPQFPFRCASNIAHEDEEHTAKHMYFENECMKSLLRYMEPEQNEQAFETTYKGYMQGKDKSVLYVVLDIEHFKMRDDMLHAFALIDEIVNLHAYKSKVIDPSVYTLFYEEHALLHLFDEQRQPIPSPIVGYQCIENEKGEYENEEEMKDEMVSILDKRMEHPLLGDVFLFSRYLLERDDKYQRYGLFIDDADYVMEGGNSPLTPLEEKEDPLEGGLSPLDEGIGSEEGGKGGLSPLKEGIGGEQGGKGGESPLYFQQQVGGRVHAFWSFPSSSYFVEL